MTPGHHVRRKRTGGPFRGIAVSLTSTQPRIGDELIDDRTLQESGRNSQQSEQRSRTCVRLLAYGPTEACPRSSGRERAQLLRHRTDPSLRDHLPPRGPRLLDGDRGVGAGDGHGHGRSGNAPFGCAPRSFQCETDPDRGQCFERTRLRGLGVCRPSLARLRLLGRRRCRLWIRGNRRPSPDLDPGPGGAARRIDRAPTRRRQLRSRPRRDGCGLHRRGHPSSPAGVPGPLPLRRSHVLRLRAGCARLDPGSWPRGCSVGERGRTGFPSCWPGSALARPDRGQSRACDDRRRLLLLHPPAVCAGAYTCPARGIGVVVFINTFFIVVAQVPATRVVTRMRRTHALFATSAIFAVGLLAVLLATLTHSTLAATTVLAGVAILIAIAECGQFIVLGPLVAEIAPPHLLGRYMSLYQLSFMVGVALGPAVGGVLLGTSPDTIWWGGALALALTGAGFLRLGNRIPDPLLRTKAPPLAASDAA